MKKGTKRLFTITLAAAFGVAGCSSDTSKTGVDSKSKVENKAAAVNQTGMPIVNEPITVKLMHPRKPEHGDFDKMWFFKEVAKKTNITIKTDAIESAGWEERKKLAFASGDLPDFFWNGISSNDENIYGPQGLLIPLNDLIDKYAPNTKSLLEKYPGVRKTFTHTDGNIYVLPVFNDHPRNLTQNAAMINKMWLDNLGLQVPKTLDELYTVLKAFKERDPNKNGQADEIAMSGRSDGTVKLMILSALGFADSLHDIKNGKYVYIPSDPAYKEYLSYMNKLYKEGLLDKEYFTQTKEQLLAKEAMLKFGFYADGGRNTNIKNEGYRQYVMQGPLTSSINSVKTWKRTPEYTRTGTFAITKQAKNPEALIRLNDYLYTLEGSSMGRGGPEYGKWDGEGGYEFTTIDGVKTWKWHYDGFTSSGNFRMKQSPYDIPYYGSTEFVTWVSDGDPNNRWQTEVIMNSGMVEVARMSYPEMKYTAAEQERIVSSIDLDSYVKEMEAKFIIGEAPLTQWDSYLANLKKMGVDEMSKVRQDAYDRWNKNK
jgi:putative aldouronate transport system substrate-binding protein